MKSRKRHESRTETNLDMNEELQRIAIAEWYGHKILGQEGLDPVVGYKGGKIIPCPDYLHDLNATHEAEMIIRLSGPGSTGYLKILDEVCKRKGTNPIFADAPQRSEAIVRYIRKWSDK